MTTSNNPSVDERRQAVCAAMGRGPSLVRYAARYCATVDDAEDVYQRAMEIALVQAPTVDADEFMAWLHTVVRNEAIALRQERRREPLGRNADIATAKTAAGDASSPETVAEWRERHRGVRDALDSLSQQQRTCVMLQSAGLTYDQIATVTGFSRRQIERSIARGRRRLSIWEDKLASGAACEQLRPTLDRILRGEATERDRRRATKHTAACVACRSSMVRSHAMKQTLAGLVPAGVLAGVEVEPLSTDPGGAMDLGERIAVGAASRVTHIAGPLAEVPLAGAGRIAAGAGAVAIACVAALPFLGPSTPAETPTPTHQTAVITTLDRMLPVPEPLPAPPKATAPTRAAPKAHGVPEAKVVVRSAPPPTTPRATPAPPRPPVAKNSSPPIASARAEFAP